MHTLPGNLNPDAGEAPPSPAQRRKFAIALAAGGLFIALVLGAFVFGVSRPQSAQIEAGERDAIGQCWRRGESAATPAARSFQAEACREMEKQFRSKFRRAP
ncbi:MULTISPECIES: hypothetical protein [Cupriavidus]